MINAIQYTILLILSFEEACVDVRALLMGKKISALKKSSDFQMKYEEICMGSKKLFTQKANVYPNDDGKRRYRLYHIRSTYGVFFCLLRKIRLKKEFLV